MLNLELDWLIIESINLPKKDISSRSCSNNLFKPRKTVEFLIQHWWSGETILRGMNFKQLSQALLAAYKRAIEMWYRPDLALSKLDKTRTGDKSYISFCEYIKGNGKRKTVRQNLKEQQ